MQTTKTYKLTEYSHGAGCGCKIAPNVLQEILAVDQISRTFPNLLVGNENLDDAAVVDLNDGTAIVSTTDFFMPIVDDAFDFGRIASVNAISDIYAMGAKPIVALAILGWPVNDIPAQIAGEVIAGAKHICDQAGIALAGGHSIDSKEPIFGLAVTGRISISHLKRNSGAKAGDQLYITKGLGVGILTTAIKKKIIRPEHLHIAKDSMLKLNDAGEVLSRLASVHAMTDVTGFGLLGHLKEVCVGSGVSARIDFDEVPLLDSEAIQYYVSKGAIPGGTTRNWNSYGDSIAHITEYQKQILADPQTSGGLLLSVDSNESQNFEKICIEESISAFRIGEVITQEEHLISIY